MISLNFPRISLCFHRIVKKTPTWGRASCNIWFASREPERAGVNALLKTERGEVSQVVGPVLWGSQWQAVFQCKKHSKQCSGQSDDRWIYRAGKQSEHDVGITCSLQWKLRCWLNILSRSAADEVDWNHPAGQHLQNRCSGMTAKSPLAQHHQRATVNLSLACSYLARTGQRWVMSTEQINKQLSVMRLVTTRCLSRLLCIFSVPVVLTPFPVRHLKRRWWFIYHTAAPLSVPDSVINGDRSHT